MGTWGTGIFSDDNAADLRDDYRDFIGDGLSSPEATDRLLAEWGSSISREPEYAATFWLALAVTQWKCGRLEDRVKAKALEAIEDGSALRAWLDSKFERKRKSVLDAVRQQIESPQPPSTQDSEACSRRLRMGTHRAARLSAALRRLHNPAP